MDLTEQRIVVTGGAGFLGSHVVDELRKRGVPGSQITVPRSRQCDLRHVENVRRLYGEADPHVVIHLAARVGGIGANQRHPGLFFYDNLIMGVHLVEEARKHGLRKFVSVGTVCSYPKHTPVPFREENLWDGYPEGTNAPYGIAKRALLTQLQAYRREYGLNGVFLLPVNLYGPRDNFDPESSHVIPALIRKCLEARTTNADKIVCWGDGTPTREFLFVEDAARGVVAAVQRYNDPEPVNLGAGFEISIRELAELIAELTSFRGSIVWDASKPNGQPRRCLDTTRAEARFDFRATTDFRSGLARTIAWYTGQASEASEHTIPSR